MRTILNAIGAICIGIAAVVFGLAFWPAVVVIFIAYLAFSKGGR